MWMSRPFARQRCFFLGSAFLPQRGSTVLATSSWAFPHVNPQSIMTPMDMDSSQAKIPTTP